MCTYLIDSCINSSDIAFPHIYTNCKRSVPFWNEEVKSLRETSLFWHFLWKECGKPNTGHVNMIMKATRANYHRAVKVLKRNKKANSLERFAANVCNSTDRDFWTEIKKIDTVHTNVSDVVDNVHGPSNICDVFAAKYKELFTSVPTSDKDILKIKQTLDSTISEDFLFSSCNVPTVIKCFNKLKLVKSGGPENSNSNHFVYAPTQFYVMFSIMLRSMLIHGFTPNDLLASVIISIPKDNKGNLTDSNNYRGISLCCALCKVVDLFILEACGDKLTFSDYQYAFKRKSSTVMCTLILKETVDYYLSNNSNVYACMLDARKAFDRLHYGKLFNILLKRNIPSIVLRLLLDSYCHHVLFIKWDQHLSEPIYPKNGVKQGAILSTVLFNVYIDELLLQLHDSEIGCFIGQKYLGTLCYADDVTLLCPSISGLQKMLNLCADYALEYHLLFNDTKTVCIGFGCNELPSRCVYLGTKPLTWVSSVKHLGNTLTNLRTDVDDIKIKTGIFISQVNTLIAKFGHLQSEIISKLFNNYCGSFYGSQTWDLSCKQLNKLCTSWRIALRKIWKLPYMCHSRFLPIVNNCLCIDEQLMCRFIRLFICMLHNNNQIVKYIAHRALSCINGTLGTNVRTITTLFPMFDPFFHTVNSLRSMMYTSNKYNDILVCSNASIIRECCKIRDNLLFVNNFENADICYILNDICIN